MKNYRIDLNERQILLIEKALDAYTRIGSGQASPIYDIFSCEVAGINDYHMKIDYDVFLRKARQLIEESFGSSKAIPVDEMSDGVKVAFDMQKVIQKAVASRRDANQVSLSVWHNGPFELGDEDMVKVCEDSVITVIPVGGAKPKEENEDDN
jgi:hypothetical protein